MGMCVAGAARALGRALRGPGLRPSSAGLL